MTIELFPPKMPILCRRCMTIVCLYDGRDRVEAAQAIRLVKGLTCRTCGHALGMAEVYPDDGHKFPLVGKVIQWWLQRPWSRRVGQRCSRCRGVYYDDELEGGLCCECREGAS